MARLCHSAESHHIKVRPHSLVPSFVDGSTGVRSPSLAMVDSESASEMGVEAEL